MSAISCEIETSHLYDSYTKINQSLCSEIYKYSEIYKSYILKHGKYDTEYILCSFFEHTDISESVISILHIVNDISKNIECCKSMEELILQYRYKISQLTKYDDNLINSVFSYIYESPYSLTIYKIINLLLPINKCYIDINIFDFLDFENPFINYICKSKFYILNNPKIPHIINLHYNKCLPKIYTVKFENIVKYINSNSTKIDTTVIKNVNYILEHSLIDLEYLNSNPNIDKYLFLLQKCISKVQK